MATDKLKELEAARAKLAALESDFAESRQKELAGLPAQYGFADVQSFIAAVEEAAGGKRKGRGRPKQNAAPKGKRTRVKITDAMRAEVKKLAEAGKSGSEIVKAVGISLPSVQNIKKALGLVKARKK